MAKRTVSKVVTGSGTVDGAGVHLTRVISKPDVYDFDPFLMLDAFDSKNPPDYINGFPWHPHRGIETITYLIKGDIEHGDSLGNRGSILDGCCQWMTAGSGILHQEMPKPVPHMWGTQLWLNLPKDCKMSTPAYRDIKASMVPVIKEDGVTVKVLSGEYNGRQGAVQGGYTQILYLDVELKSNTQWTLPVGPENTLFAYIMEGAAAFGDNSEPLDHKQAVLLKSGDELYVKSSSHGARMLVLSGKPLGEEIAWGGPIVMNTRAELQQAFRELEEGTFIK